MKQVFITLLASCLVQGVSAQDQFGVSYGPESRQFLDIYLAPSSEPAPVFIYAHPNGGTTALPNSITDALKDAGISTISWESFTTVGTLSEIQTGWDDAELMMDWFHENANAYNFDTTCIIVGGSSRGSILSWKFGHSADPDIKGLYMYNALPDGVWSNPNTWYPPDEVSADSPPIFFVYRYEPGTTDIHDPENGIVIMTEYESLGIGDRDTMIHSIEYSGNNDRFQFLVEFAEFVGCTNSSVSVGEIESSNPELRAYPNPFNDRIDITGLKGDEVFFIYSALGELIAKGDVIDFELYELNTGVYFLHIISRESSATIQLVKQ